MAEPEAEGDQGGDDGGHPDAVAAGPRDCSIATGAGPRAGWAAAAANSEAPAPDMARPGRSAGAEDHPGGRSRRRAPPTLRPLDEQVAANRRRSVVLAAAFVVAAAAVVAGLGLALGGGPVALLVAVAVPAALVAVAWWKSDAVALAVSHARPADPVAHARLHNLVEGLCVTAGLPMPRVYVVDDDGLNAFAVGRHPRHAAVVVTTGLLAGLSRIELEAVLAHELSHVKSHDIVVSTLAVTMVGTAALVGDWGLRVLRRGGPGHRHDQHRRSAGPAAVVAVPALAFLAMTPLAARLMHLAVGRRREAVADLTGVALTRYPPGLIAALEKLRDGTTEVHSGSAATAHLWIGSPVARPPSGGAAAWLGRMFDTHPPLEERIEALREL